MPHQKSFRLGWQSQNLARFILYKFCFLAEPVQIADDIGIDFFCTLFEAKPSDANVSLVPRNTFAIQVKSERSNKIDLTNYLPYLENLELPFFIGVVDREKMAMNIFSGEFLTPFFVYKGLPDHLEAELCEDSRIEDLTDAFGWVTESSNHGYTVLFPKITEITANTDGETLISQVDKIQEICSRVIENLAAKNKYQFILKSSPPYNILLFAGPESQVEPNFFLSLSEVFYFLTSVYPHVDEENKPSIEERFRVFEAIYLQLASSYSDDQLPPLLTQTYEGAKNLIESSQRTHGGAP